jgi:hypothetical protein
MAEENVKIAVLEQKLTDFAAIVQKLDNAIEKISEVNANLMRMLAVHEEKIKQCNNTDDLIVGMINSIKESNTNEHNQVKIMINDIVSARIVPLEEEIKNLPKQISDDIIIPLEKKVEDATRIKWITIGCGAALIVVTGALSTIISSWIDPKLQHPYQQNTQYPVPQLSTPASK